ncbi:hypothetical protein ACSTS3_15085 [Aquimarina muelleri]|uniref:hypothetical protein n=1 Tax=Aquimarina muelleri TaxID=279356 RepID=UPI003F687813
MVYHFHPIAFVEHMKLITAPTTPPWMEIALAEAKDAKGVKEDQAPLTTMIKKYHNHCNLFDDPTTTKIEDLESSWCSSFVSWCLDQTNYKGLKQAGSRFYIADDPKWNGTGVKSKRYKLKAKDMLFKVTEPLYGALALFSDCTKEGVAYNGGHICFVYGTVEGAEKLAVLGGNQNSQIKVSPYDCSGNVFVSWKQRKAGKVVKIHYKKFRGFYMPKDYKSGTPLGEEHHYKSFEEANKKATTIEIKTNKDGESS